MRCKIIIQCMQVPKFIVVVVVVVYRHWGSYSIRWPRVQLHTPFECINNDLELKFGVEKTTGEIVNENWASLCKSVRFTESHSQEELKASLTSICGGNKYNVYAFKASIFIVTNDLTWSSRKVEKQMYARSLTSANSYNTDDTQLTPVHTIEFMLINHCLCLISLCHLQHCKLSQSLLVSLFLHSHFLFCFEEKKHISVWKCRYILPSL